MPAEANASAARRARRTAVPVHGKVPATVRARPRGLTQPLPVPGPLRSPARPTQPLEPILFPKLRIRFADFPYLHCSTTRGCSLGDLLQIWVQSGTKITPSLQDFQGQTKMHRTPRCFTGTMILSPAKPIPGCPSLTKKRELFPGLSP